MSDKSMIALDVRTVDPLYLEEVIQKQLYTTYGPGGKPIIGKVIMTHEQQTHLIKKYIWTDRPMVISEDKIYGVPVETMELFKAQ